MEVSLEKEINELISDREKFNKFIYTPLNEAIAELESRQSDRAFSSVLRKKIKGGVPELLQKSRCAVAFRQLATPNYELRRFVSLIDALDGFTPVIFEYTEDKFTDNNEWKYYLAKMFFYNGIGKKGGEKIVHTNVIDFNSWRGKKMSEVKTLWGQNLTDFHHELFNEAYLAKGKKTLFFEASRWFAESGGHAQDYYENFFMLFVADGILFENFMLNEKEFLFTREIVLPAFMRVLEKTGKKPLIVALEPTEIESSRFWMCHPGEIKVLVDRKLNTV